MRLLVITITCLSVLVLLYLVYKKTFKHTILFGSLTYILFIALGILTTKFHQQEHWPNHFVNISTINSDSLYTCTFKVNRVLKSSNYHDKYIVSISNINSKNVQGKLLLNLSKDSTAKQLKIDGVYKSKLSLNKIPEPQNPYQFNYAHYLERQYIYKQSNSFYKNQFKLKKETHSLTGYASIVRRIVSNKLKENGFKGNVLAIIESLFLGQRQSIKKDVYNDYINAGVVHILAISGLHVGIVLAILNYLLLPMTYIKYGKYIKLICILILLWCFAIISGLSASVVRAVTMFSIVAFAMHVKNTSNIFNTLTISIFILLLIRPMFLFDVGFQLSYTAVFAIVWIKPLFDKLWNPSNKLLKFFWNIFTVSLAAQIGVTPISLFYFHQFPGLFFISNLVIIPFIGAILSLGFLVISLSLINRLPDFMARFFESIIETLNKFVAWVADKEQYLITDIAFDLKLLIPIYILLISSMFYLKKRSVKQLYFVLFSIILLQSVLIFKKSFNQGERFMIFHKSRHTLIGKHYNRTLEVHHNLDSLSRDQNTSIKNYKIGQYVKHIKDYPLQDYYYFNKKLLLVIDSLGIYNVTLKDPDYILLRNSPKVNLDRLIDSIKPKCIIVDGSNYTSYVNRWKTTCNTRKLPFHYTKEMGAFILE
jgi:competence protein ComEC